MTNPYKNMYIKCILNALEEYAKFKEKEEEKLTRKDTREFIETYMWLIGLTSKEDLEEVCMYADIEPQRVWLITKKLKTDSEFRKEFIAYCNVDNIDRMLKLVKGV